MSPATAVSDDSRHAALLLTGPVRCGAVAVWRTTAVVAWVGVLASTALSVAGMYTAAYSTPGLYGMNPAWTGWFPRLTDSLSYFTQWSNIIVAVASTRLGWGSASRGRRPGRWERVLLVASLLMITVTSIVYLTAILPYVHLSGWSLVTSPVQHVLVPLLAVCSFIGWGPRSVGGLGTLGRSVLVTLAWVVWMLVYGALTGTYPYGFINVRVVGHAGALVSTGTVLAGGAVLGLLYEGIDSLLTCRTHRGRQR